MTSTSCRSAGTSTRGSGASSAASWTRSSSPRPASSAARRDAAVHAAVPRPRSCCPPSARARSRSSAAPDDAGTRDLLAGIADPVAEATAAAERAFLVAIGGDCNTPLAAHAWVGGGRVTLRAMVIDPEGRERVDETGTRPVAGGGAPGPRGRGASTRGRGGAGCSADERARVPGGGGARRSGPPHPPRGALPRDRGRRGARLPRRTRRCFRSCGRRPRSSPSGVPTTRRLAQARHRGPADRARARGQVVCGSRTATRSCSGAAARRRKRS